MIQGSHMHISGEDYNSRRYVDPVFLQHCNSQDMEKTYICPSTDDCVKIWYIYTHTHTHNGKIFSHKKE